MPTVVVKRADRECSGSIELRTALRFEDAAVFELGPAADAGSFSLLPLPWSLCVSGDDVSVDTSTLYALMIWSAIFRRSEDRSGARLFSCCLVSKYASVQKELAVCSGRPLILFF